MLTVVRPAPPGRALTDARALLRIVEFYRPASLLPLLHALLPLTCAGLLLWTTNRPDWVCAFLVGSVLSAPCRLALRRSRGER